MHMQTQKSMFHEDKMQYALGRTELVKIENPKEFLVSSGDRLDCKICTKGTQIHTGLMSHMKEDYIFQLNINSV